MKRSDYTDSPKELVSILDYTDVEDVKVSWLWEPFIPLGDVTIVEGDGMAGKTTAMIRLASMVSRGLVPPSVIHGELVEQKKVRPSHVLYIGIEANNETEIKPAIKYGKGDPKYLHFVDQSERPFILNEEYVREAIKKSKCKLLIIDPYTNFLPNGISLGNAVSMRHLLTKLMTVARETKTAIVLVGHLSKNPYGKQIYAGFGSADIINTVRSVLLVSRDEDNIRFIRILKSNYFGVDAFFKVGLSMDDENCVQFEDYGYLRSVFDAEEESAAAAEAPEIPERKTRTNQCADAIKELLENGPVRRIDVYERLGVQGFSERTIARAFSTMGGVSYYVGRVVYWKLPETEEE